MELNDLKRLKVIEAAASAVSAAWESDDVSPGNTATIMRLMSDLAQVLNPQPAPCRTCKGSKKQYIGDPDEYGGSAYYACPTCSSEVTE